MPILRVKRRRLPKIRSKSQISYNMSRVRSTGSKIERIMEAALKQERLKPKKHFHVFGRPDFAFPLARVAVFCDSHFWHGYNWKEKRKELRRNRAFWISKISANIRRDDEVNQQLRKDGWLVFRFWEHQILKSSKNCAKTIRKALNSRRKRS
jgi:DNA mismatch endonuclease Vsr